MANVNMIYDQYSSEDFLCHKLKPKGFLLCSHCHEPYEYMCADEYGVGEIGYLVCSKCGSFDEPYEEE